jgi:hypothetical protein
MIEYKNSTIYEVTIWRTQMTQKQSLIQIYRSLDPMKQLNYAANHLEEVTL